MPREIVVRVRLAPDKMKEFEKNFANGLVKSSKEVQRIIKTALKSVGNPSGGFPTMKNRLGLIPLGIHSMLRTGENWRLIDEKNSTVKSNDAMVELNFATKSREDVDKIAAELKVDSATLLSRSIDDMSKRMNRNFSSIFKSAIERM